MFARIAWARRTWKAVRLRAWKAAVSVSLTGDVMKAHITGPACAPRHDQPITACTENAVRLRYQRYVGARPALFAAPPVDLLTLVIAEAAKRKAQAEIQRPALRDAYEMPVSHERNCDRDADIRRREYGESD